MEGREEEGKGSVCNERNVKGKSNGEEKCIKCNEWAETALVAQKPVNKWDLVIPDLGLSWTCIMHFRIERTYS